MLAGITGVIIGLLIGGAAVAIWLKRSGGSSETVASLKRENAQFREEVNEHFVQTAELINQLTDSYKAVFDHLSEGAEKLVDPEVVRERMPQVGSEEVRLKRIGTVKSGDSDQDEAPTSSAKADEPESDEPSEDRSGPSEASAKAPDREDTEPEEDSPGSSSRENKQEAKETESSDDAVEDKESGSSDQKSPDQDQDRRRAP